jgi:undecaprenyl-diphosphatase
MANACTNGIDTGFVALGYAKVAVLGVVQGITELMPISSTAHMRIVPALFGWQDPGSAFSAALQLAALAAVISYLWRDVSDLLFGSLSALGRRDFSDRSLKLAFGIAIGTIRIGIAGLALAKLLNTCTSPIRGLEVVGIACLVMALLLGLAELIARHQRSFERVGLLDCLVVGIAQVGALIPGVSRSGSTLTAALFPRLQARGGSTVLLPARPPRHCSRRLEGAGGTTSRRPRCAWLVGARRRPRHRQPLGLCRDLGPSPHPRALLDLALRRLPGIYRRGIARGRGDRMARLRSGRRSQKQDRLNSNGDT